MKRDVSLTELAERAWWAIKERAQNGAAVSSDAVGTMKHAAGEVVEAVEAYYQWLKADGKDRPFVKRLFAKEVADVVVCCLVAINDMFGGDADFSFEQVLEDTVALQERRAAKEGDKL